MEYEKIKKIILKELKENLPEHLSYHSVMHVKDVINAVEEIALAENVGGEDLMLLKTAALFHDSGFLHGAKDHEQKSCEISQKYLLGVHLVHSELFLHKNPTDFFVFLL